MGEELRSAALELYGLVPSEFTARRNAVASELKATDRPLADQVNALRKPSTAAWVVNLLVRHDPEQLTAVLDLGESLRQAQDDLDGEALRTLAKQRRRLVAAVAGGGRRLARERGTSVSESVQRQVEETLHAAMIDTDAAEAVRTGLLVDALSATGLGSVKAATAVAEHTALGRAGAVPSLSGGGPGADVDARAGVGDGPAPRALSLVPASPGPDPEAVRREQRRRARTEARAAQRAARVEVSAARHDVAEVERRESELAARALQVNGELDELRRQIDALEHRLEQLDQESEPLREERESAVEVLAEAEDSLADAEAEVARLRE